MPTPVKRIISGGQTGVDRAALDVAIALGVAHGGWCPAGRRAEDGRIPPRYRLRETATTDYAVRTERNVDAADGTLVLASGAPTVGTALTCRLAGERRKPLLVVDLSRPHDPSAIREWLAANAIAVLNVAGPRESSEPGVYARAVALLRTILAPDARRPPWTRPGERG